MRSTGPSAKRSGPVSWWVADRTAQRVFGLDDFLVPVTAIPARRPRVVRATPDGGAWILEGRTMHDVLVRLGPEGRIQFSHPFDRLLHLGITTGARGGALCLEQRGDARRLIAIDEDGGVRELPSPGHVSALAVQGRRGLFVRAGGAGLVVYDLGGSPAPIARRGDPDGEPRSPILDIACASPRTPRSGRGWWSLEGRRTRTLVRWTERLRLRWERSVDFQGDSLLADPVRGGVWVIGGRKVSVRFFADGGAAEGVRELGLAGPVRAHAAAHAGPLLALPGALIALDAHGRVLAFQGGFRGISDLSGVVAKS